MRTDISSVIAETGMALIAESGPRAASIRGIADRAGLPAPTLQHHYPTKSLLYRAIYAAAIDRHCLASREALRGLAALPSSRTLSHEAAAALLGHWLGKDRDATLVVLNLLAQAARDPAFADLALDWHRRISETFSEMLRRSPAETGFLSELLVGLALTSAAPLRAIEYEMLNREVLALALGDPPPAARGRWRSLFWEAMPAEEAAGDTADMSQRGSVRAALDAGVLIMAEAGAEALTYRNIAKRAEISTSSVQYAFPTRGELVLAVYREVRRRFSEPFLDERPDADAFDRDGTTMFAQMIVNRRAGSAPLVLASCELFLTAAWEEDLAGHAWAMRLQRGMLLHERGAPADFLPHALSLWTLGVSLVRLSQHHEDAMAAVSAAIAGGLALVGSR